MTLPPPIDLAATTATVLLIDDHPLFRKGVADLIALEPKLQLIGEADSGQKGVALALELQPDLIILDLNMKGMDGIAVLQQLKESDIDSRIIMLTVSDHEEDVVKALRTGADGYLLKDMDPEETLEFFRQAALGKLVVSGRLAVQLANVIRGQPTTPLNQSQAGLTEREQQILIHLSQGHSNKLIARELGISDTTVKVHVKHILKKLNLRTRVEAAVWAMNSQNLA
ncbi:two-component system response regulator NarL [Ectothiorhodospiraceae bacterium BW-2]|nr:two-component system response regulator NarL [Ectothiorhodospiraceae bacterium BW-2]